METLHLFAYGTLQSHQPEHALHCPTPISVLPAKAAGSLWRLKEGYPILQIEPSLSLLDASDDLVGDWRRAVAHSTQHSPPPGLNGSWVEGELMEFPLQPDVLNAMDEWECFVPGRKGPYQRRAIWVRDRNGADRIAWAYVCYSPPNWATLLPSGRWTRADDDH